jgi:hypothetical protein
MLRAALHLQSERPEATMRAPGPRSAREQMVTVEWPVSCAAHRAMDGGQAIRHSRSLGGR